MTKKSISIIIIVFILVLSLQPGVMAAELAAAPKKVAVEAVKQAPKKLKLRDLSSIGSSSSMSSSSTVVGGASQDSQIADGTKFLSSFQGKHEVSLFSGSLNYSYPIWTPKGRGGMTPDISLRYSNVDSRYSNPAGYGWSLPGNSISRVRKKGIDTMYSSDYYMADIMGQAEELIIIDATNNIYAPKTEGSFTEYKFASSYWTAKDAYGNSYTFGQTASNRQDDPNDSTRVYKWMLEKIEDTNGNFITFTYTSSGDELYPSKIRYTGFDTDNGLFEVEFVYTTRDKFISYHTGFKVTHQKILDKIKLNSYATGSAVTKLTYDFTHSKYNNAIYLLDDVQVSDGTNTLPKTQFDYFDGTETATYKKINGLYKITEPYGGTHEFTYKPASLYREQDGTSSNPLPFTVYTVYEHKAKAETGGSTYTTTYDYRNGHYYYDSAQVYNRDYAGFGKVTVTDPVDNEKIYYFHQSENDPNNTTHTSNGEYQDHVSKKGRLYREEQYDDSSNKLKVVIRKWDKSTLTDADTEFNRYHPYMVRKTTIDYGENSQTKTKSAEYTYDSYGNPDVVTDYGEVTLTNQKGDFTDTGSDKITVDTDYVYDTTDRLLRFPKQNTKKDNSNNIIGKSLIYYDSLSHGSIDKGNKTKEEIYKDATNYITRQWAYNTRGLITSETNPRNYSTTYGYDTKYLYPTTVTNAKSQATTYVYDNFFGKPTDVTDPNGFEVETDYDGFGRVEEVRIENDSSVMKKIKDYTYDFTSSPESVTETSYPDNTDDQSNTIAVTKKTYMDGFGRTVQVKQEAEGSSAYTVASTIYDERGNVKKELLPDSATTLSYETITETDPGLAYTYDALGRVKTVVSTLGTTTTVYNDWETKVTDPETNYKEFINDARGNLVEVKEYLSSTAYSTEYVYDQNNNLTKITDAEDDEKEMTYDWLGRRLTMELLHNPSEGSPNSYTFVYDANGNMTSRTDAKSQAITYTYDQLDRVLTENTTEVTYGYDSGTNGIGHLTSTSFSGGSKSLEYNLAGTLKKERVTVDSTNYDTQFSYDLLGNVLTVTYPDTTSVSYVYNNANQLEKVTNYITDIDYNPAGLVSQITHQNGVVTTDTYDIQKLYRLTNRLTEKDTTDLQEIAYVYDTVGNVTSLADISDHNGSKTGAYVYDDLYRLTSATITNTGNSQNYTRTYTYSITGNINSKSDLGSFTYGNIHPHAVTSANSVTYTYDDNGSLTGDGTWAHTWNNRNQVSSSTDSSTTVDFEYDEGGRRITKDDGTTTTLYINKYYDKEGSTDVLYVYAGGMKVATKNGSTTAFNHLDHLSGSNISTDTNGAALELNDYYPFGESRIDDRTGGYTNDYLFTGKELDRETDLYYYGARYYDPSLARFVSVDPLVMDMATKTNKQLMDILQNPQMLNAYSYVANNPLKYVDSTGEAIDTNKIGEGLIEIGFSLGIVGAGILSLPNVSSFLASVGVAAGVGSYGINNVIEGLYSDVELKDLAEQSAIDNLKEVINNIREYSSPGEVEIVKSIAESMSEKEVDINLADGFSEKLDDDSDKSSADKESNETDEDS